MMQRLNNGSSMINDLSLLTADEVHMLHGRKGKGKGQPVLPFTSDYPPTHHWQAPEEEQFVLPGMLLAGRIACFAGLHHCVDKAAVVAATCKAWRSALNPFVRLQASLQYWSATTKTTATNDLQGQPHAPQYVTNAPDSSTGSRNDVSTSRFPIRPQYNEFGEIITYECSDCGDRVWNECDTVSMRRCMNCLCVMWKAEREEHEHAAHVIRRVWLKHMRNSREHKNVEGLPSFNPPINNNKGLGKGGKGKGLRQNPLGSDGNVLKCSECGSQEHFEWSCPRTHEHDRHTHQLRFANWEQTVEEGIVTVGGNQLSPKPACRTKNCFFLR